MYDFIASAAVDRWCDNGIEEYAHAFFSDLSHFVHAALCTHTCTVTVSLFYGPVSNYSYGLHSREREEEGSFLPSLMVSRDFISVYTKPNLAQLEYRSPKAMDKARVELLH